MSSLERRKAKVEKVKEFRRICGVGEVDVENDLLRRRRRGKQKKKDKVEKVYELRRKEKQLGEMNGKRNHS